jgi:hypothetical protein
MIVSGLNGRQWPRIRTFSILVAQLETIGFVYELCHYSRRAVLSRKDPFTSNELLKIFLHRFFEPIKSQIKKTLKDTSEDTLKDTLKDTLHDASKHTLQDTSKGTFNYKIHRKVL